MMPLPLCCVSLVHASLVPLAPHARHAPARCCAYADDTLAWLDGWVIGHSICPFAAPVRRHVRTVVCHEERHQAADMILSEAARLCSVAENEPATTLVVLPALVHFADLMELQEWTEERAFEAFGGAIQLLAFHPDAEFGDAPRDPADWAMRSPHPMLHLLRDADVMNSEEQWRAQHAPDEPPGIQERNAAYLRGLGWQKAAAAAAVVGADEVVAAPTRPLEAVPRGDVMGMPHAEVVGVHEGPDVLALATDHATDVHVAHVHWGERESGEQLDDLPEAEVFWPVF